MEELKNETKLCPFCKEEIKYNALKCKHCGEWLTKEIETVIDTSNIASVNEIKGGKVIKTSKFIGITEIIFAIIFTLGLITMIINGTATQGYYSSKFVVTPGLQISSLIGSLLGVASLIWFIISLVYCGRSELKEKYFKKRYLMGVLIFSLTILIVLIIPNIKYISSYHRAFIAEKELMVTYFLLSIVPILLFILLLARSIYVLKNFSLYMSLEGIKEKRQ